MATLCLAVHPPTGVKAVRAGLPVDESAAGDEHPTATSKTTFRNGWAAQMLSR
jgi:hypothetical protein